MVVECPSHQRVKHPETYPAWLIDFRNNPILHAEQIARARFETCSPGGATPVQSLADLAERWQQIPARVKAEGARTRSPTGANDHGPGSGARSPDSTGHPERSARTDRQCCARSRPRRFCAGISKALGYLRPRLRSLAHWTHFFQPGYGVMDQAMHGQ